MQMAKSVSVRAYVRVCVYTYDGMIYAWMYVCVCMYLHIYIHVCMHIKPSYTYDGMINTHMYVRTF